MASPASLSLSRSSFDHRSESDGPGETQTSEREAVGPVQVVWPSAVKTPPIQIATAIGKHDLGASRGIFVGVLIGALGWALIVGSVYLFLS